MFTTEPSTENYCDHLRDKYADIIPEPRHFNRNDFDAYMEGSLNIYAVKVYRGADWCTSTNQILKEQVIFTYLLTNDAERAIKKAVDVYGFENTATVCLLEVYNLEPNLDDDSLTLQEMTFKKVKDLSIFIKKQGRL